jgi:DNA-binding MarR family transcriptional regulator
MSSLTLEEFVPYRLSVASNAVSTRISQSYRKRFKLKVAEWRLIAILDIGKAGELDKITVSRAASALLKRGLVAQDRNPEDGRSHFLSLTAEGKALYEQIVPAAKGMEEALLAKFSAEDRARLVSLLRQIEDAANST